MLRPLQQRLLRAVRGCAMQSADAHHHLLIARPASTVADDSAAAASLAQRVSQLAPEQQQQLAAFQHLLQHAGNSTLQAGLLTSLTAIYRNLFVVMDQFHKKDILGVPRPLVDTPPSQEALADTDPPPRNTTQQFYPIRDLTMLPDVPPPGLESHLQERFMSRSTCWQQLLPNHLEVSYQLGSFVYLWPAMEAFYPFPLDDAAVKTAMRPFVKLRRTGMRRHRRRKIRRRVGFVGQHFPTAAAAGQGKSAQG